MDQVTIDDLELGMYRSGGDVVVFLNQRGVAIFRHRVRVLPAAHPTPCWNTWRQLIALNEVIPRPNPTPVRENKEGQL